MARPDKLTIAISLAALNFGLIAYGSLANSATVEEGRQIPAGLAHWRSGLYRLASDTPPLQRMLAVLPTLLLSPSPDLTFSESSYQRYHKGIDVEIRQKFYDKNIGKYEIILFYARLSNFLWWIAGAIVIWGWSGDIWGPRGGWLGLLIWCLAPSVLATEMLATPDFAAGVAFSAACYFFWRWIRAGSWRSAALAGLLLGVAEITDFASLLLYLFLPAAGLACFAGSGNTSLKTARLFQFVFIIYLSILVINIGYSMKGFGLKIGDYEFASQALGGSPARRISPHEYAQVGNRFRGTWLGQVPLFLPEDYLYGIDLRRQRWEEWARAALDDDRALPGGRGDIPLWAAFARVPLGLWVLVAWSTVPAAATIRMAGRASPACFLMAAFSGIGIAIASGCFLLNSKSYLLAIPIALTMVNGLTSLYSSRKSMLVYGALTTWVIAASLSLYPRSLGYLNEFAGGSTSATAQALYANSEDGGQDAMLLRDWINGHRSDWPVGVACDTAMDLRSFGIRTTRPPIDPGSELATTPGYTRVIGPRPGVFAIDSFNLSKPRWSYFLEFQPSARLGPSTFVYRISRGGADEVRKRHGIPPLPPDQPAEGSEFGFVHKVYQDLNGQKYNYSVFVPRDYAGDRPYPLITMLHGFGDRGFDGRKFLKVGLPRAVEARKESFNFFVICPEGHEGNWSEEGGDARIMMEILNRTLEEYRIDRKRLYLTGVSSGAAAAWRFAARYPGLWAAIFPVATADCDPAQAAALVQTPVWCFHNFNDLMSPPDIPRGMIDALAKVGGKARYSEFVVLTDEEERTDPLIKRHNAWTKAYATEDLYDWLLENRLP